MEVKFIYPVLSWSGIDGDSIRVVIDRGWDDSKKVICRLYGIDAPEVRSKNKMEKEVGYLITVYIHDWLTEKPDLMMHSMDKEKYYGRVIGDILSRGESLAKHLYEKKLVKSYHGKTKDPWTDIELSQVKRLLLSDS